MMNKSKYNPLNSVTHKILHENVKTRYNIQDPNINDSDKILRKFFIIYKKNMTDTGLVVY